MTQSLAPAAQYLRMSTDHQQYSLDNQADAISRYATDHGFVIVKTYSDAARSGLRLKNRIGLKQLLKDVVDGQLEYRAILVYDVSRWADFKMRMRPPTANICASLLASRFTTARRCSPTTTVFRD